MKIILLQLKQILVVFFIAAPVLVAAQTYGGNVGDYITLPAPTPPSGAYEVTSSTFSTTSDYLYVASGTSRVKIVSYFPGTQTVQCDYHCVRQYTVSGKIYEDHQNLKTYYYIYCLSNPNDGGGSNNGGDTGGGSNNGGGTNSDPTIKDGDYFQDYTKEGQLMLFMAGTYWNEPCCYVVPNKYGGSCISSAKGKVTIPSSAKGFPVKSIATSAFKNLSGLTELVIPSSVESVSLSMIYMCENLVSVTCEATTPPSLMTASGQICSTDYKCILYVPQGSVSKYKSAKGWSGFKEIRAIGEKDIEPTNISVSPSSKTIKVGDTFTPTYTISPSDATTTVTWSSDNSSIASVDKSTGKVAGVKAGTTYINATTSNGKTASCKVTVEEAVVEPTSISVSPYSKTIKVGDTFTPTYTISPSNATTTVTWSSDNSSIASVSSSTGKVTGVNAGKTYIRAKTSNGKSDYCIVTVEAPTPTGIAIDETNFPDENFRNYLLRQDYGQDGVITEEDIKKVTNISVSYKGIRSLKGVEYFTALTHLYCDNNAISSLDVSKNTALTILYCYCNVLTSLDVSKNTELAILFCHDNLLTSLDMSKNTKLTDLFCSRNSLISLDVSKNILLESLVCTTNNLISLDVSKNTVLFDLYCDNNELTSLNVSNNPELFALSCSNNNLTTLTLPNNPELGNLYCDNNELTFVDLSGCTDLYYIHCYRNKIKGEAMDALISYLRMNTKNTCRLYVYDNTEGYEGNVCTRSQVSAIKAKGWTPFYYDWIGDDWLEYEGIDETDAIVMPKEEIIDKNVPIYNLAGQRVTRPIKGGIYIINGKKVLME